MLCSPLCPARHAAALLSLLSPEHLQQDQAISAGVLLPSAAAKLHGACSFWEQGRAVEGGRAVTPPILACLELIQAVLSVRPEREFDVLPRPCPRCLAASDAAEGVPGKGSGGFHLVWLLAPGEARELHCRDRP